MLENLTKMVANPNLRVYNEVAGKAKEDTKMENGKRKVLADEVAQLSILFGVSADSLLNNTEISQPATMFARSFEKLDESDQAEIMNLIRFKEQVKAQRAE